MPQEKKATFQTTYVMALFSMCGVCCRLLTVGCVEGSVSNVIKLSLTRNHSWVEPQG